MEGLEIVAQLMALSARTAPKAWGKGHLEIQIIPKGEIPRLVEELRKCGAATGRSGFLGDADSVEQSDLVVLIGLKQADSGNLDCGACGFLTCEERESHLLEGKDFKGPQCAHRLTDLGIAIGSAVSTAAFHHADNRVMLNVGVASRRLGITKANYVLGIPLSDMSKSPYFDRKK